MAQAMVLAAGRGERLRPLTDDVPKPLINVGGLCLIEHQIYSLKAAGIDEVVVNVSWLGDKIRAHLGNGTRYGVTIQYSDESEQALETAGGIIKALPLLKSDPFIVCNADVWSDIDYSTLSIADGYTAHLVLINNPQHHPDGDFALKGSSVIDCSEDKLTFSGIGVYRKRLFDGLSEGKQALAPILRRHIAQGKISGEFFKGHWFDAGTLERLEELRTYLAEDSR